MAYIDNSETKRELDEAIRGNAQTNISPASIANQVVPVININPKEYLNINVISRRTSAGTIITTNTIKDTYLMAVQLSAELNGAGTGEARISATPRGQASSSIYAHNLRATIATDADSQSGSITFPKGILLEKGSTITLTLSVTTASAIVFLCEV
jgi:hypothetical protein